MNQQTYTFDTRLAVAKKNEADLPLIHEFAASDTTLDDFAIVQMTAIDDRPLVKDGLRLIVTAEWQSANVEKFVGIPFVKDHAADSRSKLGRIFSAEVQTDDQRITSIVAKAFIAKGIGNDADIEAIRKGRDLEVSLGFRASKIEETELNGVPHVRLLASDDPQDGPFEVSSVGVGACQSCGITSIAASASSDIPKTEILTEQCLSESDRECLLFGRMMHGALVDDVVSYERQLGIVTDIKLAQNSYGKLSPFNLQDRRDALLKTIKNKEQKDTQLSVDFDELLKSITEGAEPQERMSAQEIIAELKGVKT